MRYRPIKNYFTDFQLTTLARNALLPNSQSVTWVVLQLGILISNRRRRSGTAARANCTTLHDSALFDSFLSMV